MLKESINNKLLRIIAKYRNNILFGNKVKSITISYKILSKLMIQIIQIINHKRHQLTSPEYHQIKIQVQTILSKKILDELN